MEKNLRVVVGGAAWLQNAPHKLVLRPIPMWKCLLQIAFAPSRLREIGEETFTASFRTKFQNMVSFRVTDLSPGSTTLLTFGFI